MISRPVIAWTAMVAVSLGLAGCKCCSSHDHDSATAVSKAQPQTKGPVSYMPQQNMAMSPVPTNGVPAQASWNTAQQRPPMAQAMQPDAVAPGNRSVYGPQQMVSQPMQPVYTTNPGAAIRNPMAADPSVNMANGYAPGYSGGAQMIPANAGAGGVNRVSVPAGAPEYQPQQPLQISAPPAAGAVPAEAQPMPRGPEIREAAPVNGTGAMEPTGPAMQPAPETPMGR